MAVEEAALVRLKTRDFRSVARVGAKMATLAFAIRGMIMINGVFSFAVRALACELHAPTLISISVTAVLDQARANLADTRS